MPYEFREPSAIREVVWGHRGVHKQPAGTWSDDGGLMLASLDSLVSVGFDTTDQGKRFLAWRDAEDYKPGQIFDVGTTTDAALDRLRTGAPAEIAGGSAEQDNGNGSLMRIIPVSLRFSGAPTKQFLDRVHRASAITHRHPRSLLACGLYSLVIRELLAGVDANTAVSQALRHFRAFYEVDPFWAVELDHFQFLLAGSLGDRPESEIQSSGYVVETLTSSLWCLLTTSGFEECVLRAVNLGGDTDTTGCVAGGLAGVHYGLNAIPVKWLGVLARRDEIESLFNNLATLNPGGACAPALA